MRNIALAFGFICGATVAIYAAGHFGFLPSSLRAAAGQTTAKYERSTGDDGDIPERKGPSPAELNYREYLAGCPRGTQCKPVSFERPVGPSYQEMRACERRIGRKLMTQELPPQCR